MIGNHFSAKLSELDLRMVKHIPPGGNWKNIPISVPSKRLEQIRQSCKEGKGSRSTYYGRLIADKPAYTISTYFNRPGNGCFIHYDVKNHQNRVISQREAARLQTFPDDFIFMGPKTSINKQIGNAVPPILAYQIAKTFPKRGIIVDLFTGAGGLSLGFHWAGWKSVIANDIDPKFLETYKKNIGGDVIAGDIRDKEVFDRIIHKALKAKELHPNSPLIVIGGPPCQGFSTAGKKRTMEDQRNHLFKSYKLILDSLQPDAFVFENVTGLLSMEGGKVFKDITKILESSTDFLNTWHVKTEEFGVPQRRSRVILVGHKKKFPVGALKPITVNDPVSCKEALEDLPGLDQGEDGSSLNYKGMPKTNFQKFMRGKIDIEQYLEQLSRQKEA